ncbi:MAG: DUF4177 domain-containing protein [Paracoccaceae bacterium]|nr:DUF4177 domain-containing protein [Paracoccaceae bacterium]MDE2915276.1 DUF4177 domain-containing protein [Paracoccaceae bacterium]
MTIRYEYKTEPALRRPKRSRGARALAPSDQFAVALSNQINREAEDGWEYLRTDVFPVERRSGLFRTRITEEIHFLIFRRPVEPDDPDAMAPQPGFSWNEHTGHTDEYGGHGSDLNAPRMSTGPDSDEALSVPPLPPLTKP